MDPISETYPSGAGPQAPVPQSAGHSATAARRERPAHDDNSLMRSLQSLVITIVIAVFVITFLAQAFQIPSESMENTLLIGDYLLVDKVQFAPDHAWRFLLPYRTIRRGDVIVFRWPVHPEQHFVKRVVAVPGDRVRISGGRVFVNGQLADEPFAVFKDNGPDFYRDNFPSGRADPHMTPEWYAELPELVRGKELLVPEDNYFALGDNRNDSLDSRYWGFVPRENIIGRPLIIYWSVRKPCAAELSAGANGKIGHLLYVIRHLPQLARWDRTMHFVK